MRLNSNTITAALQQSLRPLYLFFGDETLLLEEALDELRNVAKQQGFSQRERYTQETGFDWSVLANQSNTLSLFSEKRIVELRLPTGKPGDKGSAFLIDYASQVDPNGSDFDTIFVVISASIDKRAQNAKWFKSLEAKSSVAQFSALPTRDLPQWIGQRLNKLNVEYEEDVLIRLASYVEGNLLAAAQEIRLIGLLYGGAKITVQKLEQTLVDHARFDVFQLVDCALNGNVSRSIRILETLRREQAEPVVILWALARDLRILCQLASLKASGKPLAAHYRQFGVWQSRTGLFDAALKRLSKKQCQGLLEEAARIDLIAKGQLTPKRANVWQELEALLVSLCAIPVV